MVRLNDYSRLTRSHEAGKMNDMSERVMTRTILGLTGDARSQALDRTTGASRPPARVPGAGGG
eukprot:56597-Eustigmatos_ZCMA.PRE.1